jgi:hypothetical protein
MDETERWVEAYGPQDGPWLRANFAHVMAGMGGVHNVRVARMDNAAEMARYAAQQAEGPEEGENVNWQVTSPHTGTRYWMGCTW